MNKKVDITEIADWFLSKEGMTNKKVQKLCYYAIAWGWALMDRSISKNDKFEAWVHGPVSPLLYEKYKENGWNNLPKPKKQPVISEEITQLLESVWVTYGDKSGNELEALSHREAPWLNARKGVAELEASNEVILPQDMKVYYQSIYIEK